VSGEIKRGTAFLVPSGPKQQLHLHIVLTDACADGEHLVAAVSSIEGKAWHDKTCVFKGGEHKSITKPSFVFYRLTTRMSARHIKKMIEKNYYKDQPDASDAVCDAICDGVCVSEHTPRGIKRFYQENGR
jgi:hypothetical protein